MQEQEQEGYSCVQSSLKSMLREEFHPVRPPDFDDTQPISSLAILDDAIVRYSNIRKHAMLALQLVLVSLPQYHIGRMNRALINVVVNKVARRNIHLENQLKYARVSNVVQTQYMDLYGGDIASSARLTPVLDNLSGSILTMYKTNMRHFKKDVGKYVRMVYDQRNEEHTINWDELLNTPGEAIIARISLLPGDILEDPVREINERDRNVRQRLMEDGRNIIQEQQDIHQPPVFLTPTPLELQTLNVFYQQPMEEEEEPEPLETLNDILKRRPLDLFWKRLWIAQKLECGGRGHTNLFPKARNFHRVSMPIDSRSLVYIFQDSVRWIDFGCMNKSDMIRRLGRPMETVLRRVLWNTIFKMDSSKWMRNRLRKETPSGNLKFANYIHTNGIETSFMFQSGDSSVNMDENTAGDDDTVLAPGVRYIQDLSRDELNALRNRPLVGADPNKRDLLYFAAPPNTNEVQNARNCKIMRYTSMQRRLESGQKTFDRRRRVSKDRNPWVRENEVYLSNFNSSTVFQVRFAMYLRALHGMMGPMLRYYDQLIFRKFTWYSTQMKRSSEDKMAQQFLNKYRRGSVKPVLGLGDWSQRQQMRYLPPSMTKGLRKVLVRNKIDFFLIDEYRTSKKCYNCQVGDTLEHGTHLKKPDRSTGELQFYGPKRRVVKKRGPCHGMKKCLHCDMRWNRDLNSALNMYTILRSTIYFNRRPEYLLRPEDRIPGNPNA